MYGPQVLPAVTTVSGGAVLANTGLNVAVEAVILASLVAISTLLVTLLAPARK